MTLRKSMYRFGLLALLCSAATANPGTSPVGTWSSGRIETSAPPWIDPVDLIVTNVEADRRVSGRFLTFPATDGRPRIPGCRGGDVSGTFDGVMLKVAYRATSLCEERVFELKMEGERLVGKYKDDLGRLIDVTLTRKQ